LKKGPGGPFFFAGNTAAFDPHAVRDAIKLGEIRPTWSD
jgi:hypothetical protein